MPEFVHLHNHTEYSLLDGATRVNDLADIMVEHKSPAVAMTDHGNLFGAVSFYKAIKARGAKPILGCEVYVAPGDRRDRKAVRGQTTAYHLVLLVKNETGYRNLNRLVTKAYMEGFYYKPRIDWELLQEHHEGLIALSGCMQGEIAQAIVAGDRNEARRKARMFVELFGRDFYLEIQANGLPEQELINRQKRDLAAELGIPLVATNDNHYLRREDAYPHDCLLCIGTRSQLEQQDRMRFPNDQFYVKHPDEMWETFADVREALDNTLRIAEDCNFEFEFGKFHLPRFGGPDDDLDAMLEETAQAGLERRLEQIRRTRELTDEQRRQYHERLAYELGVIREMGFAGYFLIVSDFIRWAKQNRIPVGPGRGSAAGSLVSYAIEITDLDPLQYGLLFERFLNPERRSMPDIDVDICMNRRGEVIEYVSQRYGGADHVAQIAAFGTAKGRQIFKDVGRVFGLTFAETDRITKLMPDPPAEFSLKELWENDPDLREAVQADPRLEDVYRVAQKLEGITRHASVHAAGVVLSDRPLVDHLPLFRGEHGESVTQFDMSGVEEIGLVKFDFLGLKTLTAMQATVDLVKEYEGVEIDLDAIPLDDAETYRLLCEGRTAGVFQLESEGMRRLLRQLQPSTLEEVIAVTALYRPGPMQAGMVDEFVARKHGRKKVEYMLSELEPILKETYGVIVYQEQVMEIARVLAGYSLGEADILRKAMGKKKPEIMQQQRAKFVDGCVANGFDRKTAETLFDQIVEFAGYGFNKSHSACYGLIAYRTAWLKAHYPVAFMAALMQCDRDNSKKLVPLLREARQMGIEILPPDVNLSGITFTPDNGRIRFGLAAIKNVGERPAEAVIEKRRELGRGFESLSELLTALEPGTLNRKVLEGFIRAGALDSFGHNRGTLFANLDRMVDWMQRQQRERASGQRNLFAGDDGDSTVDVLELEPAAAWEAPMRAEAERATIGFYLSAHPLDPWLDTISRFANTTLAEEDLARFRDGAKLSFGAVITEARVKMGSRGRNAFLQVEDREGLAEVGVYGETFNSHRELIETGRALFFEVELKVDADGGRRMFAKSLIDMAELESRKGAAFSIAAPLDRMQGEVLRKLSEVLTEHPGRLPVRLLLRNEERREAIVELPDGWRVTPSDGLRRDLAQLLGDEIAMRVDLAG